MLSLIFAGIQEDVPLKTGSPGGRAPEFWVGHWDQRWGICFALQDLLTADWLLAPATANYSFLDQPEIEELIRALARA